MLSLAANSPVRARSEPAEDGVRDAELKDVRLKFSLWLNDIYKTFKCNIVQ